MLTRRETLLGAAAAVAASALPAVAGFEAIPTLWGDGEHDDTEALRWLFAGRVPRQPARNQNYEMWRNHDGGVAVRGGRFSVSDTIHIVGSVAPVRMYDASILASPDFPRGVYIIEVSEGADIRHITRTRITPRALNGRG